MIFDDTEYRLLGEMYDIGIQTSSDIKSRSYSEKINRIIRSIPVHEGIKLDESYLKTSIEKDPGVSFASVYLLLTYPDSKTYSVSVIFDHGYQGWLDTAYVELSIKNLKQEELQICQNL